MKADEPIRPCVLAYKHKITAYKPFALLTPAFTYCGMKSLENLQSNTFLYLLKCKSMQITPRAHLLIQICVPKQFQFKRKCNYSESRQSTKSTPSELSTKCYELFFAKLALFWARVIFTEVKSSDQQAISIMEKTLSFLSSFSTNLNTDSEQLQLQIKTALL